MELSQLNYFRATARTEHFTRAAEHLHISQPFLSKAIANLEAELGVPLFDREGKGVRLNAYGQAFLEKAEQILSLTEEARTMLEDMKRGDRGRVRIGSSFPITAPSPVYYYQYDFFQQHPNVALSLHVLPGGQVESLLEQRELDFGISQAPAARAGISSEPLYADRLGVIVGPDHPLSKTEHISLRRLAGQAFLCNNAAPDPNDSALHLCAQAGFVPNIIYEGESAELIGEAVSMGRGVSFVSQARFEAFQRRSGAPDWERALHYVALDDAFCTRTIYLLARTSGYRSQAAHWFYGGLTAYLR